MEDLRQVRLRTDCKACENKCCSQPYDSVYLTTKEIAVLEAASGLKQEEFVVSRTNQNTGHSFRSLTLPCKFLDSDTGQCTVYESRPLVCRLFPFYPEPLTGEATLIPAQCGSNLSFVDNVEDGWCLADFDDDTTEWLRDLWLEALTR